MPTGPKLAKCPYCGFVKELWYDGTEYECTACYKKILDYGKRKLRENG